MANAKNGTWKVPVMTFLAGLIVSMTVTYFREGVTKQDLESGGPWAKDKGVIEARIQSNKENIARLDRMHNETLNKLTDAVQELTEVRVRLEYAASVDTKDRRAP